MALVLAATPAQDNAGILVLNQRRYAVGLVWLSAADQATDTKIIRERARKLDSDFYCVRKHVAQQHGFGWLGFAHRSGLPVAAAMVADRLVGDWHGVFQADNGWWYLQVHADAIAPHGDQFFTTEEAAFNAFVHHAQIHNWAHSYAPERWGLTFASREIGLHSLLDDFTTTRLIPLNLPALFGGKQNLWRALIGFVVFLGLLALIFFGLNHAGLNPMMPPPPPVMPVAPPKVAPVLAPPRADTQEIIPPSIFMRNCQTQAERLVIPLAGWTLASLNCNVSDLSITWAQRTGDVGQARTAFGTLPFGATLGFQNGVLTARQPLGQWSKILEKQWIKPAEAVLKLEENLQVYGQLSIKQNQATPQLVETTTRTGFGSSARVQQNLVDTATKPLLSRGYIGFELLSNMPPTALENAWNINGLELENLEWNVARQTWTYRGKLWHPNPQMAAPSTASNPAAAPKMLGEP